MIPNNMRRSSCYCMHSWLTKSGVLCLNQLVLNGSNFVCEAISRDVFSTKKVLQPGLEPGTSTMSRWRHSHLDHQSLIGCAEEVGCVCSSWNGFPHLFIISTRGTSTTVEYVFNTCRRIILLFRTEIIVKYLFSVDGETKCPQKCLILRTRYRV